MRLHRGPQVSVLGLYLLGFTYVLEVHDVNSEVNVKEVSTNVAAAAQS